MHNLYAVFLETFYLISCKVYMTTFNSVYSNLLLANFFFLHPKVFAAFSLLCLRGCILASPCYSNYQVFLFTVKFLDCNWVQAFTERVVHLFCTCLKAMIFKLNLELILSVGFLSIFDTHILRCLSRFQKLPMTSNNPSSYAERGFSLP